MIHLETGIGAGIPESLHCAEQGSYLFHLRLAPIIGGTTEVPHIGRLLNHIGKGVDLLVATGIYGQHLDCGRLTQRNGNSAVIER